jgi:hypothetical protein
MAAAHAGQCAVGLLACCAKCMPPMCYSGGDPNALLCTGQRSLCANAPGLFGAHSVSLHGASVLQPVSQRVQVSAQPKSFLGGSCNEFLNLFAWLALDRGFGLTGRLQPARQHLCHAQAPKECVCVSSRSTIYKSCSHPLLSTP